MTLSVCVCCVCVCERRLKRDVSLGSLGGAAGGGGGGLNLTEEMAVLGSTSSDTMSLQSAGLSYH